MPELPDPVNHHLIQAGQHVLRSIFVLDEGLSQIDRAITAAGPAHPAIPLLQALREELSQGRQANTDYAKRILDPIEWEELP
jgi:hypothetical protein